MAKASEVIPPLLPLLGFTYLYEMERVMGKPASYLRQPVVVRPTQELSTVIILELLKCFPELNPCYLLTGKGRMLLTQRDFDMLKKADIYRK